MGPAGVFAEPGVAQHVEHQPAGAVVEATQQARDTLGVFGRGVGLVEPGAPHRRQHLEVARVQATVGDEAPVDGPSDPGVGGFVVVDEGVVPLGVAGHLGLAAQLHQVTASAPDVPTVARRGEVADQVLDHREAHVEVLGEAQLEARHLGEDVDEVGGARVGVRQDEVAVHVQVAARELGHDRAHVDALVALAQPSDLAVGVRLDADLEEARPVAGLVVLVEVVLRDRTAVVGEAAGLHRVEELVVGLGEELATFATTQVAHRHLHARQAEGRVEELEEEVAGAVALAGEVVVGDVDPVGVLGDVVAVELAEAGLVGLEELEDAAGGPGLVALAAEDRAEGAAVDAAPAGRQLDGRPRCGGPPRGTGRATPGRAHPPWPCGRSSRRGGARRPGRR